MINKEILFKFQLPLIHYNRHYHEIISQIRINNGVIINQDKVKNNIVFEVKFLSSRDLSTFQKGVGFTLDEIS